jgi:hypothetical protein
MSSTNISDVLKQLDAISVESGIEVLVPSLGKTIKFRPLNLKQQKGLLKTSIDESLTRLSFNSLFYDIIKDNILEQGNINELYTFDRSVIALALRCKGLDSNYTAQETTIDLNSCLDTLSSINVTSQPLNTTVEDGNIIIKLQGPKLGTDKELNDYAVSKSKSNQDTDFKTVIGELFVYELVKFISSVSITTETGVNEINFKTIPVDDKIILVEKLPSTVTNKILEFVKSYRTFETQFTNINGVQIDIDGSFFTV